MNNPDTTISNQPFFETVFTKNKKIIYALPVVIILIIGGLYYLKSPAEKKAEENNIDVSLPGSETKELANDKLAVNSDFSELNEEKEDANEKADNVNIENIELNGSQQYQNENDEKVVKKVNSMIYEMEKEKKRRPSYNSTPPIYEKPIRVKNEDSYESKNITEQNFSNFFNEKSSITQTNPERITQEKQVFIYASIKGDHLRLKNNSRVCLILSQDITLKGNIFKRNTLVYAQASFYGNRLNLTVNNINQVPINLKAYDAQDGNIGLQVQQSLAAETSNEITSDGVEEVDVNGIPLGNTIKRLFKKKQQEPKIDLLNNQRLILKLAQ